MLEKKETGCDGVLRGWGSSQATKVRRRNRCLAAAWLAGCRGKAGGGL